MRHIAGNLAQIFHQRGYAVEHGVDGGSQAVEFVLVATGGNAVAQIARHDGAAGAGDGIHAGNEAAADQQAAQRRQQQRPGEQPYQPPQDACPHRRDEGEIGAGKGVEPGSRPAAHAQDDMAVADGAGDLDDADPLVAGVEIAGEDAPVLLQQQEVGMANGGQALLRHFHRFMHALLGVAVPDGGGVGAGILDDLVAQRLFGHRQHRGADDADAEGEDGSVDRRQPEAFGVQNPNAHAGYNRCRGWCG